MRVTKGKTQASNGDVCSHLSAFNPINTASPSATTNWVPRLAYRRKNCLLLFDGGLLFIAVHLYNISTHVTLSVESCGRFQLQFSCIQISSNYTITPQLQQFF